MFAKLINNLICYSFQEVNFRHHLKVFGLFDIFVNNLDDILNDTQIIGIDVVY